MSFLHTFKVSNDIITLSIYDGFFKWNWNFIKKNNKFQLYAESDQRYKNVVYNNILDADSDQRYKDVIYNNILDDERIKYCTKNNLLIITKTKTATILELTPSSLLDLL